MINYHSLSQNNIRLSLIRVIFHYQFFSIANVSGTKLVILDNLDFWFKFSTDESLVKRQNKHGISSFYKDFFFSLFLRFLNFSMIKKKKNKDSADFMEFSVETITFVIAIIGILDLSTYWLSPYG